MYRPLQRIIGVNGAVGAPFASAQAILQGCAWSNTLANAFGSLLCQLIEDQTRLGATVYADDWYMLVDRLTWHAGQAAQPIDPPPCGADAADDEHTVEVDDPHSHQYQCAECHRATHRREQLPHCVICEDGMHAEVVRREDEDRQQRLSSGPLADAPASSPAVMAEELRKGAGILQELLDDLCLEAAPKQS
jgi:hypothetical protein